MADAGQLVGDYQVLAQLGAGGMGRVYKVRNVISNREEAMKILLPDFASDPELARRFMAEIRTLATLEHPGIAQLRTAFQANNQFVMVMEFVEGTTLERLAAATTLPIDRVLDYAGQALEALSYAHSRGVVHRDIKPANIMITTHGLIKLMDFGIAKSTEDMQLTRPGTTMGSVYYMSPEQVRGGTIDARSDIYSFGVTLYEMLTGRKPFQADTSYTVLNAQLNQAPTPPVEVNPSISPELNAIILRALAKLPEQRFQSASEFRDALRALRTEHPGALDAPAQTAPAPETAGIPPGALPPDAIPGPVYSATAIGSLPASAPTDGGWAPVAPVGSPPPVASAAARVGPDRPASPKSHRGLWIGLGAVTAILALAALATVLPKVFSTHAGQKAAVATAEPPNPSPAPQSPSGIPAPGPAEAERPLNAPSGTTGAKDPSGETQAAHRSPYVPEKSKLAQQVEPGSMEKQAASTGPATPPMPSGPSAKDLRDARDRYSNLQARADAAIAGVQQIRGQQQAAGYDIRGDILAAMSRLQNAMRDADRAIGENDLTAADGYLRHGEAEAGTLEKFLGR